MAELGARTTFVEGNTSVKLIDEETFSVCSPLTLAQIKTYLQNNRPAIWNIVRNHTTELEVTKCSRDDTRFHYTIMLDRP